MDGTKLRANASRHKVMSYARMVEREPELAALVKQILDEAEAVDAAEDEQYGDARGDEFLEHLRTKQGPLEAIRKAEQQLEDEAADQAADKARVRERRKAERRGEDPDEGGSPGNYSRGAPDPWNPSSATGWGAVAHGLLPGTPVSGGRVELL